MGAEVPCRATFQGRSAAGRAKLETDTVEFKNPSFRVTVPLKTVRTALAIDGRLRVSSTTGVLMLDLGAVAPKWAERIRNPRSRLDKIGVKARWRVSVVGQLNSNFVAELERTAKQVSRRLLKQSDAIFLAANSASDLKPLVRLKSALTTDGALWVIRPKGRPEISEKSVMIAGKAAGLVDVKVVSFSPTHTAEICDPCKDR